MTATTTQPDATPSPWPGRLGRTAGLALICYLILWIIAAAYDQISIASRPGCPSYNDYDPGVCTMNGHLHITRQAFLSWQTGQTRGRAATARVGGSLIRVVSGEHESGRAALASMAISLYLRIQGADLNQQANRLFDAGCDILEVSLTANQIGLPTYTARCSS